MTFSRQQHGARLVLLLLLPASGCFGPDVTYGENVALRPKAMAVSDTATGGTGGVVDQASGAGGAIGQEPNAMPPVHEPVPTTDGGSAGSLDADVPELPVDAGVIPDEPEDPPCDVIPTGLLEPTTDGVGLESGCAQMVCASNTSIDSLDLNGLGIALAVHDPSEFRDCTAVFGDLIVHNYSGADLSALSCLEAVSGSLLILGAPNLESLAGLDHLQYVAGNISIGHAASYASDVRDLADISALSQLRVVLESLAIHAPALSSLHGLERLRAVGDTFELGDAATLYDLTGLPGLRAIGGDFVISGASGLRGFSGADGLERIGGSFHFGGSLHLRAFEGALASVRCVGGRVAIQGPNPALEELDLFPSLRRIGGDVWVQGNARLQSITMLSHVEDIGGSFAIRDNGALAQVDLGSLEELGGVMVVVDNPQLEECPLVELAGTLGRTGGSQIIGNARVLSTECGTLPP